VPQARIETGLTEQVPHDRFVESQEPVQQGSGRIALFGHELDQVVAHERRIHGEVVSTIQLCVGRRTEEVERQIDARPALRHIVLQKRVQALVPRVELGRERDDDQIELEAREAVKESEAPQRRVVCDQLRELCLLLRHAEQRGETRVLRPARSVALADVEAAERITSRFGTVRRRDPLHRMRKDPVESLERPGEIGESTAERGRHRNRRCAHDALRRPNPERFERRPPSNLAFALQKRGSGRCLGGFRPPRRHLLALPPTGPEPPRTSRRTRRDVVTHLEPNGARTGAAAAKALRAAR
jgi:hypothetical protein